ncbi:uncharacterized protein LOC144739681 [Lampetra planeri]
MVMPTQRRCLVVVVVVMMVMMCRTDGLVCVWCNLGMDCKQLINCEGVCYISSGNIANRTGVVRGCAPHQCDRPNLFLPSDATLRCCDTDLCNRLSILDVVQGSVNLEVGSQGFSYSDSGNSAPRTAAFGGWSWLGMSALIGLASTFQGV